MAILNATTVPRLLHEILSFVLIMINQTCTKTLLIFKLLWPGLSENFVFSFYTSDVDSNFWKKCSFGSKNSIGKVGNFLKSNFDLNQICKIVLTQSHWTWIFIPTDLLCIFIKDQKNALKLWKISKKWKFEGEWTKLWPKIYLLRQQNREIE